MSIKKASLVLKLIKKIINKLKSKLKSQKNKEFNSFEQAEIFCKSKNKNCYETEDFCKYRFAKLQNYLNKYKNYSNVSSSTESLFYAILLFQINNPGKIPNIIDFGGACGENIILLSTIFGEEIFKTSWILESPTHSKTSKLFEFSRNIQFASNLEDLLNRKKIDIFYTSCAIHYLKDPYFPLKLVARKKIPIICLTRNNFSINPKYYAQVSNISSSGAGEHLKNFKDREIWLPTASINESKVKDIFKKWNYKLKIERKGVESGIISKKDGYSLDLCFSLL